MDPELLAEIRKKMEEIDVQAMEREYRAWRKWWDKEQRKKEQREKRRNRRSKK